MCRGYVLVVEDDLAIQNAVADLIREEHGVKTASDGRAALEIIRVSPPPSLILLDMMMPGMNGAEFINEKNRLPALAAIPVVVMTATSHPHGLQLPGVSSFLRKPFDVDALMSIVERYC
ncbi:MAG TPA: response regulator [Polyangia bacterium]|nr:response regulator [Polyangia bacterium]